MTHSDDIGTAVGDGVLESQAGHIARIYPHIARLIDVAARRSSAWVTREELINELLLDNDAKKLVDIGASGTSMTIRKYAGNTIDWWSADYTKNNKEIIKIYRPQYVREEIDEKDAYWPVSLGLAPRKRKVWINNASWLIRNE